MDKETLVLVIQELKVLKGDLIFSGAIDTTQASFLQLAISHIAESLAEEVTTVEPLNKDFVDLCSFLLMKSEDGHVEVLRQALGYGHVNLIGEVAFYGSKESKERNESQERLNWLEDIRSLLPPLAKIETPSSADLFNQIRGGKEDE